MATATKRASRNGKAHEQHAEPQGDAHEGEPPKNPGPAFRVGPIVTGKGESVAGCVWEKEYKTQDDRTYKVHSIHLEARYYSDKDGEWKTSTGYRASQLSAVAYILRQCGDFVFAARDSARKADEEPIQF